MSDLFDSLKCAGDIELFLARAQSVDVDVEGGAITSAGSTTRQGGAVRVLHEGRLGFAYFTSDDQAQAAVDQAMGARQAVPEGFAFAEPEQFAPAPDVYDASLATLDIQKHLNQAEELLAAAQEALPEAQVTGGGVSAQVGESNLYNSNGVAASEKDTHCSMGVALVLPDGDGNVSSWYADESHHDTLSARAIGEEAARRTKSLAGPIALPSGGDMAVIFKPEAMSELLGGIVGQAVDGDEALRGRSMWRDALGNAVANEGLQLLDDPLHPTGLGLTNWDGEGRATRTTPIIEDGVLQQFIFDTRDAARHGQTPTAHAQRGGTTAPPSTGLHHMVLHHDNTMPLAEMEGDLVIESVLGAHTANAATGDFSITAPNVWKVRDGELKAVKEVAIGGNFGDWLMRMDAASSEARQLSGAIMPSVRVQKVAVSM